MDASVAKNHVLIFKAPKENIIETDDEYVKEFSLVGMNAQHIPVLNFEFVNLDVLKESLHRVNDYSGLILTSIRAVDAISKCIANEWCTDLKMKWNEKHNFVVGQATGSATENMLGLSCQGSHSGSAESLAKFIIKSVARNVQPFLFPCGSLKRETLPKLLTEADLQLECVTVYNTCQHPGLKPRLQSSITERGVSEYCVFFSPSGVKFAMSLLRSLGLQLEVIKFVAIGPTTQEALQKENVHVFGVAAQPNAKSLVEAIVTANQML